MGKDNENKELLDLNLRSLQNEDTETEGEEAPDDNLVQRSLKVMKEETARILAARKPSEAAWLLAASGEKKGVPYGGLSARSYGIAVDAAAGEGTVIECIAFSGKDRVEKGDLDFVVQEVTGIERGGYKFEITTPFDYLKNKLKNLFIHNACLNRYHVSTRESVVEIVPKKGGVAVIWEAKSLELAVIMSLLSTLSEKPIRKDILFSAAVDYDGKLLPVGDVPLKLKIAKKEGKKEIILPEANRADCPERFLRDPRFSITFFSHISQVTQYLELPFGLPSGKGENKTGLKELGGGWKISPPTSAKAKIAKKGAELGISENTILEIMEVAEDLAQMRNERNPVSTALVVGDTQKIKSLLPPAEVRLRKGGRIINLTARLGLLSSLVNGEDLGFVVNENGVVDSIRKFNIDLRGDYGLSPLLGWMDHKCALISKVADSMVFYLTPSSNRIHLFCSGEFIAKFINATWCTTDLADMEKMLGAIVSDKGYDRDTVNRVARCALRMSWLNLGGLFAVFSADTDLEGKTDDRLTMYGLAFSPKPLEDLTDEDLINLAKEDGATLIDGKGFLRNFMCFLRPSSRVELDFELGAGSRRINAQRFSYEANCLTVVVSEDGGVSFYSDGKRVFRI